MIDLNQQFIKMQKVPATAKIFFLQNLSVMIKAGLPLAESLKTLEEQTKNKKLKIILTEASEKIRQGKSFSESLSAYQKDFGELFINMIKAGEVSGNLEGVLKNLHQQSKKDHDLKMKIRNAMTYPVVIVFAIIGIGLFMLFFVLPNITKMFKDLNTELPLPTKILISISSFIQQNGWLVGLTTVAALALIIKALRTKRGKKIMDGLLLRLPVISPIIKKTNLARLARSLGSLIKTEIAIADSFSIVAKVLSNSYYRQALTEASEQVKKGEKLETIFKRHKNIFSPIVIQMISVGEETGALDEILADLADFYEEEVTQTMETLPTIIEPILMLLMGLGVAGIALAIMLPMYSITQNF